MTNFNKEELALLADALITRVEELNERISLNHMVVQTTQWRDGCTALLTKVHEALEPKTKCEYCDKLAKCEKNSFDNSICTECYDEQQATINQHHKDVGMSCYCSLCM